MNKGHAEEKDNLRSLLLKKRDCIPLSVRRQWSRKVRNNLFRLPEVRGARTIAFFASFRSEVFTFDMIREALLRKKHVCLPVTDRECYQLLFRRIFDLERDLAPGAYGIPEPRSEELPLVEEDDIELVVTPGAAFDMLGHRLGYGGGFYDRLFAQIRPDCLKVGIAFSFQLVDAVPHEPTDVPVDIVVTDQNIIRSYELRDELREARSG